MWAGPGLQLGMVSDDVVTSQLEDLALLFGSLPLCSLCSKFILFFIFLKYSFLNLRYIFFYRVNATMSGCANISVVKRIV